MKNARSMFERAFCVWAGIAPSISLLPVDTVCSIAGDEIHL